MNFFKIFLLQWEQVFEHRSRSLIYFLITVLNAGIMIMYWTGVHRSNPNLVSSSASVAINTYYLLYMIFGVALISHIEEDVAMYDIKEGQLVNFLLKPVSYYWMKFFYELPYRVLQGSFGVIIFLIAYFFVGKLLAIQLTPLTFLLSVITMILAYFLAFTFKMIIAFIAFWTVDIGGVFEVLDIVFIIFTGNLMPLYLFPSPFSQITQMLPFAYMIYYPIRAVQGFLSVQQLLYVVGIQLIWLGIFLWLYAVMWGRGVKRFSGVGQ